MSNVVDELLHKRSELTERQAVIRAEITRIDQDIAAVDRVLALLDPAYQAITTKKRLTPRRGIGLSRGELSERILEILRDHKGLTAAECAEHLASIKDIPINTTPRLKSNVAAALAYLAKRKRIRRFSDGDSRTVLWKIAR